jgi:hypothetical protein
VEGLEFEGRSSYLHKTHHHLQSEFLTTFFDVHNSPQKVQKFLKEYISLRQENFQLQDMLTRKKSQKHDNYQESTKTM